MISRNIIDIKNLIEQGERAQSDECFKPILGVWGSVKGRKNTNSKFDFFNLGLARSYAYEKKNIAFRS